VAAANGKRLDELALPKLYGRIQLARAEELGLRRREHDLVDA
jgi:hypothetical protein